VSNRRTGKPAAVFLIALNASACTSTITIFSDSEPLRPTDPPAARNGCDESFSTHLTDGLGVPTSPPPTPEPDLLLLVMDACTAAELVEANDYFSYPVGEPMTYLGHRRLFDGPDPNGQLAALCASEPYSGTRACTTEP
jgi:hypothetical protein